MSFEVPEHVQPIRERVRRFIETEVYPVESVLEERGSEASREAIGGLMAKAKEQGLIAKYVVFYIFLATKFCF